MKSRLLSSAVSAAILIAAGSAFAHDGKYHVAQNTELKQFGGNELTPAAPKSAEVPLWPNLLGHRFETSTSSTEAQDYIDQAMMLTFGFNHAEAARSFRRAQEIDPSCAICFWGEALVLGPNINLPMQEDAVAPAYAAAQKAKALAGKADDTLNWATDREVSVIDPYYNNTRELVIMGNLGWDGLMFLNLETGEYEPLLATEWKWVDDTTLELTLREGVTFHDGSTFGPEDVVYTVNHVADESTGVLTQAGAPGFAGAWLRHRGLDWAADLLPSSPAAARTATGSTQYQIRTGPCPRTSCSARPSMRRRSGSRPAPTR